MKHIEFLEEILRKINIYTYFQSLRRPDLLVNPCPNYDFYRIRIHYLTFVEFGRELLRNLGGSLEIEGMVGLLGKVTPSEPSARLRQKWFHEQPFTKGVGVVVET
ncbi:MAG: hypothetical protein KTR25_06910 [Myxococcales bacterium]|nr:hypothetical protein [Myxococcales bacterium]